jgi:predicted transposase YbfD/YdcC
MSQPVLAIKHHFRKLQDPRIRRHQRHQLIDIVVIALCAVIAGCKTWTGVANFGRRRQAWLATFLALPNGIPSHDTFERVFQRLNPKAFAACFGDWIQALAQVLGLKQIAIDGKTLRRSGGGGLGPLHLVSAWATANHLSLGQVATAAKSNEITAIPQLLELLDLQGALVTIDAMGCQKDIAGRIVAGGADYILTVKDNQPRLLADIQAAFAQAAATAGDGVDHDAFETTDHGHGRDETRGYLILRDVTGIRDAALWPGLTTLGLCYHERTRQGHTSVETRYFIGSNPKASARSYGKALRNHWGIENNLHWQLDVSFREDESRIRERNAAENFAQLRKVALGLLKRHPSKESIVQKQQSAMMDTAFLEEVLCGPQNLDKV